MSIAARVHHRKFASRQQEAIVSLLVASAHVQQQIADLMRAYGVTHDQYNVLRILRGVEAQGMSRGAIGQRMMSKAPDVTRLLDRLEGQGLISRRASPTNRRLSMAHITTAGLDLLAAVDPELHALQHEMTAALTRRELEQLSAACSKLVD